MLVFAVEFQIQEIHSREPTPLHNPNQSYDLTPNVLMRSVQHDEQLNPERCIMQEKVAS